MNQEFVVIADGEAVEQGYHLRVGEHVVPPRGNVSIGGPTCVGAWIGTPTSGLCAYVDKVGWAEKVFHKGEVASIAIDIPAYQAGRVPL